MLSAILLVFCAADAVSPDSGISLIREENRPRLQIRSHTFTATLRDKLTLDEAQTRAVTRIVLDISARAEAGPCRVCRTESVAELLCRLDRSIEKLLSARQRVLYQHYKRERAERLKPTGV